MKTMFIVMGLSILMLTGCTTPSVGQKPVDVVQEIMPYIQPAVSIACTAYLNTVNDLDERVSVAKQINSVSDAINQLASGTVPSADDLKNVIAQFSSADPKWVNFSNSIRDIYVINFNKLNGDSKLAVDILKNIAAGCKDASASYVK